MAALGANQTIAMAKPEILMFIENPGGGKSSIINSLIGSKVADMGVSVGSGMTSYFEEYFHLGRWYFDTPGL
jgi:ribosome biogenesis GTPase A